MATAAIRRARNAGRAGRSAATGVRGAAARAFRGRRRPGWPSSAPRGPLAEVQDPASITLGVADVGGGSSELVVGSAARRASPGWPRCRWARAISPTPICTRIRRPPRSSRPPGTRSRPCSRAWRSRGPPRRWRSGAAPPRCAGWPAPHLDRPEFARARSSSCAASRPRRWPRGSRSTSSACACSRPGCSSSRPSQAAFGVPLELVGGGVREGVLLELGDSGHDRAAHQRPARRAAAPPARGAGRGAGPGADARQPPARGAAGGGQRRRRRSRRGGTSRRSTPPGGWG